MAIELKIKFLKAETADGIYQVLAKGFAAAMLCWADSGGALEGWTAFAYVPLDAVGKGEFHYLGGRSIPPEATHIFVRAVSDDLKSFEEALVSLPENRSIPLLKDGLRICVMSDLHLSAKPYAVRKALLGARDADMTFLIGDLTNDGTSEQFELLKECVQNTLPEMKLFPVLGNHDVLRVPDEENGKSGTENYFDFQRWVLSRTQRLMPENEPAMVFGPDGTYAVRLGEIEIIGLQAVTAYRKFLFEDGRQLKWLEEQLDTSKHLDWHVVLCHAPLLKHNPKRVAGKNNPYLNRDKQLQEIVERHDHIIFLSGHTHLSMNHPEGCVEYADSFAYRLRDTVNSDNIYINDGSVRTTDLLPGERMQPSEWKDGTRLELVISKDEIEIMTVSVRTGRKHARGYYRIPVCRKN